MIKTYELINDINLTTTIRQADGLRVVSFAGGARNSGEEMRHGRFTTADEAMQRALEADSGFGRVFRCITPEPSVAPVGAEVDEMPAETREEEVLNVENSTETPDGLVAVPGITNKQGAIEWLAANRGIDGLKPTCRAEAVRNAAAIHGVSFPDWK